MAALKKVLQALHNNLKNSIMKKVLIYCLALLVSCKNYKGTDNLVGTYTANHFNEFDKTKDTLLVTQANDAKGIYKIIRKASYIRTLDGKVYPKKIINEIYFTMYKEEDKILEELRTGKVFIYNSSKETLMDGNTEFLKNSKLSNELK